VLDIYRKSRTVAAGDVSLLVTDNGDAGQPVVLMVHGWPDTAYVWRHQVSYLVERGYRVIAPDMHGRGHSDRPPDLTGYKLSSTIPDLVAVLDHFEIDTAHVVGHDFGALVTWVLAMTVPERVGSLTTLSVGHPSAFASGGLKQMSRSWYMLLFQFQGVAEEWLRQNDWENFRRFVGNHPETEQWISVLSQDGALESSLDWYRANSHPERLIKPPRPFPPVRVPTQGLWSSGDFALTEIQMEDSGRFVDAEWRYKRLDGLSHWMQLDDPDAVSNLLLEWFSSH
jgi:pimeloyl-ACP methyl ester carboxylesterase